MRETLLRAHNRFRHWEPYLGLAISGGFFTWIARRGRVMGVDGWEEAVFVGVAAAAILMLALAAILAGYRYFSPLPAGSSSSAVPRPVTEDWRLPEVEKQLLATLRAEIAESADGTRDYAKGLRDALLVQLATEAGERTGADEKLQKQIEQLGALNNENRDFARSQIVSLYNALYAIQHGARADHLSKQIEDKAAALRTPTEEGAEIDEFSWELWKKDHEEWRQVLGQWCQIADCYAAGVAKEILSVSEADLQQTGVAKSDQFPSPEAFILYKGFSIRYMKWRNWRAEVADAILRIAQNGTAESRPLS